MVMSAAVIENTGHPYGSPSLRTHPSPRVPDALAQPDPARIMRRDAYQVHGATPAEVDLESPLTRQAPHWQPVFGEFHHGDGVGRKRRTSNSAVVAKGYFRLRESAEALAEELGEVGHSTSGLRSRSYYGGVGFNFQHQRKNGNGAQARAGLASRAHGDSPKTGLILTFFHSFLELWRVERLFRNAKSLLSTRPIFHHCDATICGHVFISFLTLILLHELDVRQEARGEMAEWSDIRRDLDALQEVEVSQGGRTYWLRTPIRAVATVAFRVAGVAIPPNVRES